MQPATIPLRIIQGATLRDTLRIMQPRFEYRPITAIASTAPVRLTVDHGLPANWLCWIQGVTGMQELNRAPRRELPHRFEVIDEQTLEINTLSAVGLRPAGGQLIYQPPVDLTGSSVVARLLDASGAELLQIPATIAGLGLVDLELTDEQTGAITGKAETWTLDVITHGDVYRALTGPATVWPAGSLPSCASNGWVTVGGEQGPVGAPGRSVVAVEVDGDGYLIVTMDDGAVIRSAEPVNRPWGTIGGNIEDQGDLMALLAQLENAIPTRPEDIGAAADDDPRLSDPRAPAGGAGGVLSGSYPNPGFAVDMATQAELDDGLATKADKVPGKGLSTEDFTTALREKLVGLEGTHWRGTFASVAALESGVTDPAAGDYADVDGGASEDVARYIWDVSDAAWVKQSGDVAPLTASQVKQLYESNPDTNAFSDAEKSALAGKLDATATAADSNKLGGQLPSYYATAAQVGDISTALDLINGEVI